MVNSLSLILVIKLISLLIYSPQASQLIKLVILLLGSCVSFHVIAVLFGAPLSEYV